MARKPTTGTAVRALLTSMLLLPALPGMSAEEMLSEVQPPADKGVAAQEASPRGPEGERPAVEIPEGIVLDDGWYTRIDTTMGVIVARLLPGQAPQAVAHFAALAEGKLTWNDPFTGEPTNEPYYDGVAIHKVEAGSRLEAGDRTGTGKGAAPFWIPPEGFGPITFNKPGRLGMTRAPMGRISGSLFFISASGLPFLSRRHPCFGKVVHGLETVYRISSVKTYSNGKPIEDVILEKVRIFKVGDPDPLPDPEEYTAPAGNKLQLRKPSRSRR